MPRPKLCRTVIRPPVMEGFKPFGIPIKDLEPVILLYEEYEAVRLVDYEELTHEQAALKMNVSRPTFTRIYEKARHSIAQAFVECKAVFIEGGNYHTDYFWYKCNNCMKLNISRTRKRKCNYCHSASLRILNKTEEKNPDEDSKGFCICINCGLKVPHTRGKPCRETRCPNCGNTMLREGSYHHQLYLKKKGETDHENSSTNKR